MSCNLCPNKLVSVDYWQLNCNRKQRQKYSNPTSWKYFFCLTDCQALGKRKLDFALNSTFTALNPSKSLGHAFNIFSCFDSCLGADHLSNFGCLIGVWGYCLFLCRSSHRQSAHHNFVFSAFVCFCVRQAVKECFWHCPRGCPRPLAKRPTTVGRVPAGRGAVAPRPLPTRFAVGFECSSKHTDSLFLQS